MTDDLSFALGEVKRAAQNSAIKVRYVEITIKRLIIITRFLMRVFVEERLCICNSFLSAPSASSSSGSNSRSSSAGSDGCDGEIQNNI
ncbi:Hypothetical predicted protein [Octopus vulgaris]|uniref:Uncharacterized protein n=1 Tax=Octopus vulgaris TaxID=6645 RepID=A0AA36F1F9_OCTVU|nr:Hypothetical predicted protein [Octopus vulgaris]